MNARELFASLNSTDENERIEAKRGSEVGKSMLETVCAFANEPGLGGGWILLGVVADEMSLFPAYIVEGVENPDKVSADLASQCKSMFNVPVRVDITTEMLEGLPVIRVFVHEAQPHDKPVYLQKRGLPKGALRRIGSTDQVCTEDDLTSLYQGKQQQRSFDTELVKDATLDDFSAEAIADYRQSCAEVNPDAEVLRWSDADLLDALGGIRREGDTWFPTVAGLILFGKPMALRRCFPMTRVDYIRVPGREWVPNPDRRFDTVELRDPLLRLIRRATATVLDDLPKAFGLAEGELQRRETPAIPLKVIREALVNALMHRNYRSHSPVQIIRYANRLEIRNPGYSLKPQEQLGEPGSLPRNPKIAAVMHETRFAETKGSGIRAMREAMREAGLTPPLFESDRAGDLFVARYLFHHFLGEGDIEWLARFKDLQLSDDEAKALVFVREIGAIDNAAYRELNGVDTLAASQVLRRLRDAGLLEQKGKGSATHYLPTAKLLGTSSNALSRELSPLSRELDGLSRELSPLSRELDGLSRELSPLSRELDEQQTTARVNLLNLLPGGLAEKVGALGQRASLDEVRVVILELMQMRDWRLEDMAILLKRNQEYMRNRYIQPLLQEGKIEMTIPTDPTHPNQAYRLSNAGS
jgi:ATP-dependent DNA helicase RecG